MIKRQMPTKASDVYVGDLHTDLQKKPNQIAVNLVKKHFQRSNSEKSSAILIGQKKNDSAVYAALTGLFEYMNETEYMNESLTLPPFWDWSKVS